MMNGSTVSDVLVHVGATELARARVRLAVGFATHFASRLTGLHVTPSADVPHRYKPGEVGQLQMKLAVRLADETKVSARIFHNESKGQSITSQWRECAGDVAEQICIHARYADLVVVGQDEIQEPIERHPLPVANAVVLGCGRPVLVVPQGVGSLEFGKVVIAWDGSREAVRAVHDALPMLKLAHSVEILSIVPAPDSTGETDTKDLAAHLANHGIRVALQILKAKSSSDHSHLRDHIAHAGCDLVVMGAYSHPSWFEFVFGGATQSILSTAAIPVLVSH